LTAGRLKKASHYKQPLPVICRGQHKWYNPFVEDKKCVYVAPSTAGLDKRGGREPIYQRRRREGRRGGERERNAVGMERRTRACVRGVGVLLPAAGKPRTW
jgi:hypothetical protein